MAVPPNANYLNAVGRAAGAPGVAAQAQFAALSDPNRISAQGFVYDGAHANVGAPRFGSDMGAIAAMTPTYYGQNKYAHIDTRPTVYKTEGQTFADVHHLQTAFIESIVCILAEDDFIGTRMYPLVPIDSIVKEISIRITTYNPGIALPTPDLGVPTMLTEQTNVITGGLKRHSIGQVQGLWYGMTDEAMKSAAPRMAQLHGAFNSARLLRCYDEIYRHASPESVYTMFGIRYGTQDPVEAFRRLQIAAARNFGMCGKNVQTAGMALRKFFEDVLSERRCKFTGVLAPPAFSNFGIDADALSNPMVTSQNRIDATFNGTIAPMDPVVRGVEVGIAKPIPTSANSKVTPLIHVSTNGLVNPIGDPQVIQSCPPESYRSPMMDVRVRCHDNDRVVPVSYGEVLRKSGLFAAAGGAFGVGSVVGTQYLNALRARAGLAQGAPPTMGDLVRVNDLERYFEALFPQAVGGNAVGGYFATKRLRFTPAALTATLVQGAPAIAGAPAARNLGAVLVTYDDFKAIELPHTTLATFELMLANDIPVPIPFVLFRPTVVSEMGHVIGMDLGAGSDDPGIGVAAQTPEITTTTTTLRQLATNNIVAHIAVVTTHPERLATAYDVIPINYVGGGGAGVADITNPATVTAFRAHVTTAGGSSRDANLPYAMIPIPVFARELASILASQVFTIGPHVGTPDMAAYAQGTPLAENQVHKLTCAMAPVFFNRFFNRVGVMSREDQIRANFSHNGTFTLNSSGVIGLTVRPVLQAGGTILFSDVLDDGYLGKSTDTGLLSNFYGGRGITV